MCWQEENCKRQCLHMSIPQTNWNLFAPVKCVIPLNGNILSSWNIILLVCYGSLIVVSCYLISATIRIHHTTATFFFFFFEIFTFQPPWGQGCFCSCIHIMPYCSSCSLLKLSGNYIMVNCFPLIQKYKGLRKCAAAKGGSKRGF